MSFLLNAAAHIARGAINNGMAAAILKLIPTTAAIGNRWWILKAVGLGGGTTVVVASGVFSIFAPYLVTLAGFGPAGPVTGSLAAYLQMLLYGNAVPARGLFAMFQSFAMGGAAGGTAVAAWQAASGVVAAAGGTVAALSKFL
ncbi:hypothetical protein CALCODRAFT_485674 [Calocera cornea HHB12733]|uniref:Uncharacterized protein n=1 Tax=Calocera cornea HHB12733 TaxID=1353952 RepID=A0A165E8C8_9BASI|nr:hypothetical protein CALCODRAFT_485674 [Calocera cornea HHB12733]